MEASQAFTQPTEITDGEDPFASAPAPADDPFGGSDFGDFEQAPAPAPAPAAAEPQPPAPAEPPVVDREGQPVVPEATAQAVQEAQAAVEEAPLTPEQQAEQQAAEAAAYEAQHRLADAPVPRTPAPGPSPEAQAALADLRRPAQEPAQTAEPVGDTTAVVQQPEPAPEPAAPEPAPEPAPVNESSTEADAPVPEETKDEKGKVTHRRYVILQVTGPGRFEQVSWYEKDGKYVPKGTPGSARQTVCLARGTDDALRVGFAAVGAPQDGTTLIAVAALYFQPKRIKPEPVQPSRMKLSIG